MSLALLYAGQGGQRAGMGRDFYEEYPAVREIFDFRTLDVNLRALCFEADLQTLSRTENTQPCMGAFAAAVTRLLYAEGIRPAFSMGLSLGEYGALHAAGVLDWRALLGALAFRGQAMADAAVGRDFKMSAVLAEAELAERAVLEVGGEVWCCNYNCPGQTVISGTRIAVEAAEARAKELGARRCLPLNVGGPFHTPFMRPAAERLTEYLAALTLGQADFPVFTNLTGGPVDEAGGVREALALQICSPVRFEAGLRRLAALGVTTFVEIGPGSVLSGFVKKTVPDARAISIDTTEDYRAALAALREG